MKRKSLAIGLLNALLLLSSDCLHAAKQSLPELQNRFTKRTSANAIKPFNQSNNKEVAVNGISPVPRSFIPLVMPNAAGIAEVATTANPLILQIHMPLSVGDVFVWDLQEVLYELKNYFKDFSLAGILLICDTQNSLFTDSNKAFNILQQFSDQYTVPIYTYIDGECLDLSMLIAAAASKIYASNSSLIGNIGLGPDVYFNYTNNPRISDGGLGSIISVTIDPPIKVISSGEGRDAGYPWAQWPEGSFEWLENLSLSKYDFVLQVLASNRPNLSTEALAELGSKIVLAEEAQQLGLIDVAGASREDTLIALATEAGVIDKDYRVVEFFPQIFFGSTAKEERAPGNVWGRLRNEANDEKDPLARYKAPQIIH